MHGSGVYDVKERMIGVEEARGKLGQLVSEVASGGGPVQVMKWGQAMCVLVSKDEYVKLKTTATQYARAELARRLEEVRTRVLEAGLDPSVIDEAMEVAREG